MIEIVEQLLAALAAEETAALATVVGSRSAAVPAGAKLLVRQNGATVGSLSGNRLGARVRDDCLAALRERAPAGLVHYAPAGGEAPEGEVEVFLELVQGRPRALVVGAGHIGVCVSKLAKFVGFDVVVLDDRPEFATRERLPDADRVVAGDLAAGLAGLNVGANTYVVLVARGHKQDEEALRQVVGSRAAYIGMIGSRRRIQIVKAQLLAEGYAPERVEAIRAPIGLAIGAETPEEIAVAIVAEMLAVMRHGALSAEKGGR